MINFTTYFDKNYIHKFFTLYESLNTYCKNFKLYAFLLDDTEINKEYLNKKNLIFIKLSNLEKFYPELYYAKKNRSKVEYYFTLTPFICKYVFENYKIDHITYLDSDLYFFNDPTNLYQELQKKNFDIFITRHDNPKFETKYGNFNVGWILFKKSSNSLNCINEWCQNCINWCYDEIIDYKFADQKYLDYWSIKYEKVYVLENNLVNIGPWNISKISKEDTNNIICYHFHNLNIYFNFFYITNISSFSNLLQIDKNLIKNIYSGYVNTHIKYQNKFNKTFIKKIRGHKIKNKIIRFMKFLLALIKFDLFLIK